MLLDPVDKQKLTNMKKNLETERKPEDITRTTGENLLTMELTSQPGPNHKPEGYKSTRFETSKRQLPCLSTLSGMKQIEEEAMSSMFFGGSKKQSIISGKVISPAGKSWQMLKILMLMLTPVLILMVITLFFLANSIMERQELNHHKFAIETSTELGRLIKVLQAERDQSVLYLSLLGSETKTYLLDRYIETDNTLELLSVWPVNLVHDNGDHFHSKAAFQRYLTLHRRSLDLLLPSVIDEINFYTNAANVLMKWLYNAIVEFRFGSIWNSVVAYQKMIGAAEDAGIERALGGTFFTHEDFDHNANYLWFNEALNTANYNYKSAMKYSTMIKDISVYDNTERYSNLSVFVANYRNTLQRKMITKTSLKEASLYFDNMTLYVELLFNIQQDLADDIFTKLGEKISSATSDIAVWILLVIFVIALCPVQVYIIFRQINDVQYCSLLLVGQNKELDKEKKKTDSILQQMFPKEVVLQLKNHEYVPTKYYKDVTLFFSTIDNFAKLSIECSPIHVINLLEEMHLIFDLMIEKYDVYKVQTISDQYMVTSGLPNPNGRKHVFEIANLALDIVSSCGNIEFLSLPGTKVKIRIGIHTGDAMAGVVGSRMRRFCVFGDTVNTATCMESTGAADKIHISAATFKLLNKSNQYAFEKRGKLFIKGKGEMLTFWLLRKKAHSLMPSHTIIPQPLEPETGDTAGYVEQLYPSKSDFNNWMTPDVVPQDANVKKTNKKNMIQSGGGPAEESKSASQRNSKSSQKLSIVKKCIHKSEKSRVQKFIHESEKPEISTKEEAQLEDPDHAGYLVEYLDEHPEEAKEKKDLNDA